MRRHNLALVLGQVADGPPRTRAELAQATGLTRATVSALIDELLAAGLLSELDARRGRTGRPGNPLQLRGDGAAGLGLEINVDYLAACVVDLAGVVRGRRVRHGDNRQLAPRTVLRRTARLAEQVLDDIPAELPVTRATLALPGIVDVDQLLRRAPNLPDWRGFPVASVMGVLLAGRSVVLTVDNEANLAARAELWYGGRPDVRDFVQVSGEVGIGAGLVIGGTLFRGSRGYAGELGHVTVVADGPPCGCGGRGCLEQFAGQEALIAAAGSADADSLVLDAEGGGAAIEAIQVAGRFLGIALGGVLNVLDLPAVVLGGMYARLGRWLVEPISTELACRVVTASWAPVQVYVSTLGPDAAVRGAAGAALREALGDLEKQHAIG